MKAPLWLLACVFLACNTLPVGYDELGRIPETGLVTLTPDSVLCYGRYVSLGSAKRLLLGQDLNFRARCLVRFAIPETLSLDSVVSMQFVLYLADTTRSDTFSFVCYPCSTEWEEPAVSWALAKSEEQWLRRGGDYYDTVVARGAVVRDSVVLNIEYQALDSSIQRAIRANGLLLLPATLNDTGFVVFHSAEAEETRRPRTRISYRGTGNTRNFVTTDDATLCDTVAGSVSPYELLVGSGFVLRTWLRFLLREIPSSATVASAELSFRPTVQYLRGDSIPLSVQRLSEPVTARGINPNLASPTTTVWYSPRAGDTIVRFNITSLVQYWTASRNADGRDTTNYGVVIAPDDLSATLFRLRLPSSCSLKVQYVLPPVDRFTVR